MEREVPFCSLCGFAHPPTVRVIQNEDGDVAQIRVHLVPAPVDAVDSPYWSFMAMAGLYAIAAVAGMVIGLAAAALMRSLS